ncbi:MAG TPA: hypothetical protein VMA72_12115 [Streptosporangiaceae bacterium]|nr:hypothetical protein [Streptosporangiaceae bacterium]
MLDVRRLAALDMHGFAGSAFRRSIIRAEFVLGAVAGAGLGIWVAVAATSVGWQLFGAWVVGMGANYAALAWQAALLSRPGALEAELADVDLARDLRRYSVLQFWIVVPLLLAVLTVRERRTSPVNRQCDDG